jgi:hypothetical protein
MRIAILIKVISVKAFENYKIKVSLSNNRSGFFDVAPYLDKGVFQELKDPRYFRQVKVAYGGVMWPHEQDLSAETIECELQPDFAANPSSCLPFTAKS